MIEHKSINLKDFSKISLIFQIITNLEMSLVIMLSDIKEPENINYLKLRAYILRPLHIT